MGFQLVNKSVKGLKGKYAASALRFRFLTDIAVSTPMFLSFAHVPSRVTQRNGLGREEAILRRLTKFEKFIKSSTINDPESVLGGTAEWVRLKLPGPRNLALSIIAVYSKWSPR